MIIDTRSNIVMAYVAIQSYTKSSTSERCVRSTRPRFQSQRSRREDGLAIQSLTSPGLSLSAGSPGNTASCFCSFTSHPRHNQNFCGRGRAAPCLCAYQWTDHRRNCCAFGNSISGSAWGVPWLGAHSAPTKSILNRYLTGSWQQNWHRCMTFWFLNRCVALAYLRER